MLVRMWAAGLIQEYGVPLIVKGQVTGVLEVLHREPLDPDPEWLGFLRTLAGQVAIAIDDASFISPCAQSSYGAGGAGFCLVVSLSK